MRKCPIGNACGINSPVQCGLGPVSVADEFERLVRRALVLLVHTRMGEQGAADVLKRMTTADGLCAIHSLWEFYSSCGIDSLDKVLDTTHSQVLTWCDVCRAWMDAKDGIDKTDVLEMAKKEIVAHVKAGANNKTPEIGSYDLFDKACRKAGCSNGSEIVTALDGTSLFDL